MASTIDVEASSLVETLTASSKTLPSAGHGYRRYDTQVDLVRKCFADTCCAEVAAKSSRGLEFREKKGQQTKYRLVSCAQFRKEVTAKPTCPNVN